MSCKLLYSHLSSHIFTADKVGYLTHFDEMLGAGDYNLILLLNGLMEFCTLLTEAIDLVTLLLRVLRRFLLHDAKTSVVFNLTLAILFHIINDMDAALFH